MFRIVPAACLVSLVLVAPAVAQVDPGPPQSNASGLTNSGPKGAPPNHFVSKDDRKFLQEAAKDNQGEIRLSVLGEAQAKSPAVKAFSRLMVDDHTLLEAEIGHVMSEEHEQVPTGVAKDPDDMIHKLDGLHGGSFDLQYMSDQITLHHHAISKYEEQERDTGDESIRALTEAGLPILHQHLALAEAVNAAIHGQQPTGEKESAQSAGAKGANGSSQQHASDSGAQKKGAANKS